MVIVAVAIIVLLGVIALFYSSWFGGTGQISGETAKAQACNVANRLQNVCTTGAPSTITLSWKTYIQLEAFCVGEYGGFAIPWAANSTDARRCLRLAFGLQC